MRLECFRIPHDGRDAWLRSKASVKIVDPTKPVASINAIFMMNFCLRAGDLSRLRQDGIDFSKLCVGQPPTGGGRIGFDLFGRGRAGNDRGDGRA